jgi:predicted acyltransferase
LTFWDLVLPGFFFGVGAALPYALAKQARQQWPFRKKLRHAGVRSAKLVLLAVIISSVPAGRLQFPNMEVLFHIAVTYFCAFLIVQLSFRRQVLCATAILLGHLALFLAFPGAAGPFSPGDHIGAMLDRAVLGSAHPGNYSSLNILPGIVTTLFGAWAALLLRSGVPAARKPRILASCALCAAAAGLALAPFIPVIKRTYTLSYTLVSGGCVTAAMALLVWLIDVKGYRRWVTPLTLVGVNCIFAYSVAELLGAWLGTALGALTGQFALFGAAAPVAASCARLAVIWYLCYWLYQKQIVIKL